MATPIWAIEGIALDSTGEMVAGSLGDLLTDVRTAIAALPSIPDITPVEGSCSFDETDAGAQTLLTLTITEPTRINAIWVNGVNLTQALSGQNLYFRMNGVDYSYMGTSAWNGTPVIVNLVDIALKVPLVVDDNFQIITWCAGGGAGIVSIPYKVM